MQTSQSINTRTYRLLAALVVVLMLSLFLGVANSATDGFTGMPVHVTTSPANATVSPTLHGNVAAMARFTSPRPEREPYILLYKNYFASVTLSVGTDDGTLNACFFGSYTDLEAKNNLDSVDRQVCGNWLVAYHVSSNPLQH